MPTWKADRLRETMPKAWSNRLLTIWRKSLAVWSGIHELYMQHTQETGQVFDEACFPMIWDATEGQPWLVNALGREVTYKMKENRDRSVRIIPEMIDKAIENIIYRRDTHIDILIVRTWDLSSANEASRVASPTGFIAKSFLASLRGAHKTR